MLDVVIENLERRRMKLNENNTKFEEGVNNGKVLYLSDSEIRNHVETTIAECRISRKLLYWESFREMAKQEN